MNSKVCKWCEIEKDIEEFRTTNIDAPVRAIRRYCRDCYKKATRYDNTQSQLKRTKLRRKRVIDKYGGKCVGCGEDTIEFLCINHIHGGGGKHIRSLKGHHGFYKILDNNPVDFDTYNILCHNCNLGASILQKMTEADKNTKSKQIIDRRKQGREVRSRVLDHYGRKCECCGEDREICLAIDHINGGGNKHKKEIGGSGAFSKWLLDNSFPEGFRTLCHNCNFSKGRNGYCPHRNLPEDKINV